MYLMKTRNRSRTRRSLNNCVVAAAALVAGGFCFQTLGGVTPVQPKAGDPLVGLTAQQLSLFEQGKVAYSKILTVEEGRGPLLNKSGCISCHANPLGGWGTIAVTRFGFVDKGQFFDLGDLGGSLLQAEAILTECAEFIPEEANVVTSRVTNSSLAFGLIEAIPDAAIAANADPNDRNRDGVSGRVHWVTSFEDPRDRRNGQPLRAGRFGWKAQLASVLSFSADASLMEMGLTNRFLTEEVPPNGDASLLEFCDFVPDPEDGPDQNGLHFIDHVTNFQRLLAPPPQTPKSGMTGEVIFNTIGCAKCHIAEWTTSNSPRLEAAIRNKTIRPYSDFLLHDMGLLSDPIVQGDAQMDEVRTPTLWNLRTRDPMLHDGSVGGGTFAERVDIAILLHGQTGSEAANSVQQYESLNPTQKNQLIDFLASLGKLEFDSDDTFSIDIFDYFDFRTCFEAGGVVTPDDYCAIHDINQDGSVDVSDFDSFLTVYEGEIQDCNNNGIIDLKEILLGLLPDSNDDGIADESACVAACPSDLNGDTQTDGADLGLLLANWGNSGEGDLNNDSVVDGADLGLLLAAWGPCR